MDKIAQIKSILKSKSCFRINQWSKNFPTLGVYNMIEHTNGGLAITIDSISKLEMPQQIQNNTSTKKYHVTIKDQY